MRTKRSYLGDVIRSNPLILLSGLLAGVTVLSGAILASNPVSADNDSVVDDVNIVVPTACTMNGTGTNSHNATITPGTSNSAVGETTIKAFCNDSEGFAIYAIGYTGNTDGNNTLTSTALSPAQTIATGTGTSGNSQWAMKLATASSPTPTYPITIQNSYDSFHTVPDDYDLVAKRMTGTDVGTNAEGSTLTSTYQVYISTYQPADTYNGQVKYVLVHPNFVDEDAYKDAVTVVFDGNGLTFPNGETTNTVKYAKACRPGGAGYVANTPYTTVGTSNLNSDGTQNETNPSYSDSESILQPITVPGADKVKVVVEYGMTADTIGATIAEGTWDGDWETMPDNFYEIYDGENNISGTKTFIFDGDSATVYLESWATPESGYDKGIYVRVYPIYNTEQPNTTYEELPGSDCSIYAISGNYQETDPWKGEWSLQNVYNEDNLKDYLLLNYELIKGTTVNISAHNPYFLKYDGNGASNEFGMGIQKEYKIGDGLYNLELILDDEVTLIPPNYKRSNYGFLGWSTDPSAASHIGATTIYGPSETITINQSLLNTADNNREITLYATWLPSSGNIQNWSGCSSMSIGDTTALTDTRDNDTYAVAKLADGNCWMIENLRLGGDNSIALTTSDTQSAGILPANTTTWAKSSTAQNLDANNTLSPPTIVHRNKGERNYAYGNLYSWATAINSTDDILSGNATTSICPVGWELPDNSAYLELIDNNENDQEEWDSNNMRIYPNNFVFSGRFNGNEFQNSTNYVPFVGYWTSVAVFNKPNYSYTLSMNLGYVSVSDVQVGTPYYNYRYYGFAVRCVLTTN